MSAMATSAIQTLFLRDTTHGGSSRQPWTVARHLAEFVAGATSTLDIAIYDFRLTRTSLANKVVNALIKAAADGITVRIAYDAGKPTAATKKTFALMAADPAPPGTAQWVADHFGNSDVQLRAITAPSGQLMHCKYIVRDSASKAATVWTGSTNWTDDAWTLQENNIITVASKSVAAAFQTNFNELWSAGSIKGTGASDGGSGSVGSATVAWDFAPGDGAAIDQALTDAVTAATERIVLATMVLTSHPVLAALVAAIDRGVPVSGIYDSGQMGPIAAEWKKNPGSATTLANWNKVKAKLVDKRSAPYTATGPHNFMHNKILITDGTLATGSYNFSANAEKNSENQLHFSSNAGLVKQYADYIATIVAAYG